MSANPTLAASQITRIGQSLLAIRNAYSDPGAVLVGTPPDHMQLDQWAQQIADAEAIFRNAVDVVRGLLKDVRVIVDRGEGYAGRW